MALAAIEHPTPVHLLADAVHLVRTAARLGPLHDPLAATCLRALVGDLVASSRDLEAALTPTTPAPAPLAVVPRADAVEGRTVRPGSLQVGRARRGAAAGAGTGRRG